MHIKTETQDFYIDLVFNHFILKCFVLIDLKTGVLKHKDIGQMYMCVRIFHDTGKADDDNPMVGIVKYKLVLPVEDELSEEFTHRNASCVGFAPGDDGERKRKSVVCS